MFLKSMMRYRVLIMLFLLSLGCNFHGGKESVQKDTVKIISAGATDTLMLPSDVYDSKITELKKDLSSDFSYTKNSYFLIVSNLSESETSKIIDNTVNRAVGCFYNNYIEKRPSDLTVIFLFKDDASYRKWAKQLYDDDDLSRFGYYKPNKRTMLMNISTGTGTLVHEMTHAVVRYDFPDIPAWFNEGLGSLYERCSLNNGEILGYVNWRLPRLQEALNDGTYTSLESLMKTSDDNFYGSLSDYNYAQARYLCMYLQEKGVLKNYYKTFRDGYENDKSGISYLEKIMGSKIKDFDKDYVAWVKTLKYE